jgi:ferredoxin--NADP+ reductase
MNRGEQRMYDSKHVRGVVTSRRDLTAGLWIVRVRPDVPISVAPGQYLTLGIPWEGKLIERPYSLASAPEEPELEFFLELVSGGKLTPHLYDVPPGGEVAIRPAARGRFALDTQSGHPKHFMIATVTGAAPFVSMVRHLAACERSGAPVRHRIAMLHAASAPAELGYLDELRGSAQRHEWFTYTPTISRPWEDPGWTGERGRAEDVLRKYLDAGGFGPSDTTAYACGNPHMIRNVAGILERIGFSKDSVRQEVYFPA